jgi:hypothetical protein
LAKLGFDQNEIHRALARATEGPPDVAELRRRIFSRRSAISASGLNAER